MSIPGGEPAITGATILIVDDTPENLRRAEGLLAEYVSADWEEIDILPGVP